MGLGRGEREKKDGKWTGPTFLDFVVEPISARRRLIMKYIKGRRSTEKKNRVRIDMPDRASPNNTFSLAPEGRC